ARGGIFGLTRGTKIEHIVRAAQESIAYQSAELVFAMEADTGATMSSLKVDGGASRDSFLMGFQADILGAEVVRPESVESTALGAAALAGLTVGVWQSREDLEKLYTTSQRYLPTMSKDEKDKKIKNWRRCVGLTKGFAAPEK
ncbi:MAG: glycerol kinase, partial [Clostridia bacterium]|nr:glycerol kinase [Clostridia bacterium]